MSQALSTGATDAPRIYRDTALTNVAVSPYGGPCELTGWNIINTNTSDVYVKFCNATSGVTIAGTTEVVKTLVVPAQSTIYQDHGKNSGQQFFSTGMTIYAVTGLADSNTTAPTTAIYIEVAFKPSDLRT